MNRFDAPDGRSLVFDDEGPKEALPVLCLAGLSRDARDFAALAAHLVPRYRVIRLDARGRGRSAHAEDPMAEYTVPVEVGDIVALLDHLNIPKAAVVGTSRGGIQAMVMAAMAKDRLAGVVLNDIGPGIERDGLEAIMVYLGRDPGAETMAEGAAALKKSLASQYPDFEEADWLAMAEQTYLIRDGRPVLSYDASLREPSVASFTAEKQPDLWPLFDMLEGVPLACIRGALSYLFTAETLEEMMRRRPDMMTVTLDNRGHIPLLDEPPAVALIDRFLESLS
ncbi:MAG: alpha/beta hydrolase [Pseudomonadota bacterium]